MSAVTRRDFLRVTGAAVCGVGYAAALGPVQEAFPAATVEGHELSVQREETFRAIIETLDPVVPKVDKSRADEVVARLARRYAGETPELRANIDLILDTIGAAEGGAVKRGTPKERAALMRDGISGHGGAREHVRKAGEPARSDLFANAVSLAIASFPAANSGVAG
jgi:hypothetical protein